MVASKVLVNNLAITDEKKKRGNISETKCQEEKFFTNSN